VGHGPAAGHQPAAGGQQLPDVLEVGGQTCPTGIVEMALGDGHHLREEAPAQFVEERVLVGEAPVDGAEADTGAPRIVDLVAGRGELTDATWERTAPLLPVLVGRGRPWRITDR